MSFLVDTMHKTIKKLVDENTKLKKKLAKARVNSRKIYSPPKEGSRSSNEFRMAVKLVNQQNIIDQLIKDNSKLTQRVEDFKEDCNTLEFWLKKTIQKLKNERATSRRWRKRCLNT